MAEKFFQDKKICHYALVHIHNEERSKIYAEKLTTILDKRPVYTAEASPIAGVHNGIGTCATAITAD